LYPRLIKCQYHPKVLHMLDKMSRSDLFKWRAVEMPQVPAPTMRIVESKDSGDIARNSVGRLQRQERECLGVF